MEPQPPPLEYGRPTARNPLAAAGRWAAVIAAGLLIGLVIIVLLPADEFSRQTAERAQCASHLHQIGLAIHEYCDTHDGEFPGNLADAAASGDGLDPSVLVCPASTDTPAPLPTTTAPTTRQVMAALATPGHVSYVYRGRGWHDRSWRDRGCRDRGLPADAVVAYEPVADHGTGSNVLFGDGHAEWIAMPHAARLIAATAATTRPVSAAAVP